MNRGTTHPMILFLIILPDFRGLAHALFNLAELSISVKPVEGIAKGFNAAKASVLEQLAVSTVLKAFYITTCHQLRKLNHYI